MYFSLFKGFIDVGDKFEILVTDSGCWRPIKYIEKIANIMILPPTSEISHHRKVTNIIVTYSIIEISMSHQSPYSIALCELI